jgi:hypothetical protein
VLISIEVRKAVVALLINIKPDHGGVMADTDKKKQLDKFKDAARELECDDDEQRFEERLGKLIKPKRVNHREPD